MSYAYLRKFSDEQTAFRLSNPAVEVLIDSGAFSVLNTGETIELRDYMAWLKRWKEHVWGFVALDVLGDAAASDRNLQVMLDADPGPHARRGRSAA
jgi:hypothetical protein